MRRIAALTACLLTCLTAGSALAQQQPGLAPPGASAIDEYVESIPTAGGDKPTRSLDRKSSALTPKQQRALGRLGEDGKRAAALAAAVGPRAAPARGSKPGDS